MRFPVLLGLLLAPSATLADAAIPVADEVAERARSLAEKVEAREKPLAITGELGTALSRGNTETLHLHASLELGWTFAPRWLATTRGRGLYERSNVVTGTTPEGEPIEVERDTAVSWLLEQRVDRFLGPRIGVFGGLALERNPFAGLGRRSSAQLGVTYLLLESIDAERENLVTNRLQVDIGGYGAIENRVRIPYTTAPIDPDQEQVEIVAARVAGRYVYRFARGRDVGLDLEVIQDFVDTSNVVLLATGYVAAAFTDALSLKIAVTDRYDAVPPQNAQENDLLVTAGLVVNL